MRSPRQRSCGQPLIRTVEVMVNEQPTAADGKPICQPGNAIPLDADRIRIEMDEATAETLYAALYGWGEHIAAGAPLPDSTPEDDTRLGKVIDDLWWHLRRRK